MKALGFKRIDRQGRFSIPKEYLKKFDVKSGDDFEIFIGHNKTIVIQKLPVARCVFCNNVGNLMQIKINGKAICQTCLDLLKESMDK